MKKTRSGPLPYNISHIELIGPPGAGKSTLHQALTNQCEISGTDEDIYVESLQMLPFNYVFGQYLNESRRKVWSKFLWKYALSRLCRSVYVREYPNVISIIEQAGKIDGRNNFPAMYYCAAEEYICLRDFCLKPFALDEGNAHLAAEILLLDQNLGKKFLQYIPSPDIVIKIECSPEVCWERQIRRSKPVASSLKKLHGGDAIKKLHLYNTNFDIISKHLGDRGAKIVKINTEKTSINDCINEIKEKII